MIIALDLDDILCNTQEIFIKFYNKIYNDNLEFNDFEEYDLSDIKHISKKEEAQILEEFDKSDYFDMLRPLENAQEIVSLLGKEHKIIIITARTLKVEDQTKKWVKKYFPEIKEIFFISEDYLTCIHRKSSTCREMKVNIMIEDKKKFAIDCSTNGTKVLLFNYPLNKKIEENKKIIRVNSWTDILEKIYRHGDENKLE